MVAGLILAFSLMFLLAAGAIVAAIFGIRELRKTSISAFQHLKATSLPEVVQAQTDLQRAQIDVEQLKDAWNKEMQETAKIPQQRKKTVRDVNGKTFNMDELEIL